MEAFWRFPRLCSLFGEIARLRGLEDLLLRFLRERSLVADALTFCDLTTSPLDAGVSLQGRARK